MLLDLMLANTDETDTRFRGLQERYGGQYIAESVDRVEYSGKTFAEVIKNIMRDGRNPRMYNIRRIAPLPYPKSSGQLK